jgi:hypothetical protein
MTLFGQSHRAQAGSVAVEFALIGPTFLGLVLVVLQLGFLLFAQTALDYAAKEAARQLQTGVARTDSASETGFRSLVFCPILGVFLDCSRVVISVEPVSDYHAQSTQTPPMLNGQINPAALGYDAGQSGNLMLLRAYYTPGIPTWPLNVTTLIGTAAFRNEF